jgi:hypothetical protein
MRRVVTDGGEAVGEVIASGLGRRDFRTMTTYNVLDTILDDIRKEAS